MKNLKIAVFLALAASTGLYTQTAHAFTYTQGDVLLGFRSTNGANTTDYLIDVGQSLFAQAAAHGGTVTIGNFNTDLSAFDPNWFTDGTTLWGVGGANLSTDTNTRTLYAGYAVTSPTTTPGSSYNGQTNTAQQTQLGKYNTVGNNAQNGGAIVAGSTTGDDGGFSYPGLEVQSQVASNANSWATQVSASVGVGFGHFSGFEGTLGTGAPGDSIAYYQILPATSSPSLEGTFSMSSSGTLTFSEPVPEPSALAALAGGVALLGLVRRRRPVTA